MKILKNFKYLVKYHLCKRSVSSLFVTGDKGNVTCSVLVPHIDFDDRIQDQDTFQKHLLLRNITTDLSELKQMWNLYKSLQIKKDEIELNRKLVAEQIQLLKENKSDTKNQGSNLKIKGKQLRNDLKHLMPLIWDLERKVVHKILELPNRVADVPSKDEVVTDLSHIENIKSHLEIAKEQDVLVYSTPYLYYLNHEAALLELQVLSQCTSHFKKINFSSVSSPDFVRNIVMEGYSSQNPKQIFTLENHHAMTDVNESDKLHLTGGASVFPFLSYLAKNSVDIPIRMITQARQYINYSSDLPGLYGVKQQPAVQLCIGTDQQNALTEFLETLTKIKSFLRSFNIPLKLSYVQPSKLEPPESLRVNFLVYSPFYKNYYEVGNLSLYDDYISKRLLMYYSKNNSKSFLHVISGTVVKFPVLLASLLEHYQKVPDVIHLCK